MYCENCGNLLKEEVHFCTKCGIEIPEENIFQKRKEDALIFLRSISPETWRIIIISGVVSIIINLIANLIR